MTLIKRINLQDCFCFVLLLFLLVFLCRAYGLMWKESMVWMAIISLCWFNCVTDLVAPSKRPQWTIPAEILGGKSTKKYSWEWKLINYLWNWQGKGLEGGVCSGEFVVCVIRKSSVKFLNDLFGMLRANYAWLCLVV